MQKNKITILVVDDEDDICNMVSEILKDEGYEVRTANGYNSALDVIEKENITLILTDIWKNTLEQFNEVFYQKSSWCKNNMNFARFLFFVHFPEVKRVIYLDWDMIVLADIFELESQYNDYENMIIANCGKQSVFTNIFVPEFRFTNNYNILLKIFFLYILYNPI